MQNQEIKIELSLNGHKVKVGHKFLEDISRDIPDIKENKKIFSILSLSNNDEVRKDISRNENLSKGTINILLEDKDDEVVDNVLINRDLSKYILDEQIVKIIDKNNTKHLSTIAENIDNFSSCDRCKLVKKLAKHESSKVRYSLLSYCVSDFVSTRILEKLCLDEDSDVSYEAKKELKDRLDNCKPTRRGRRR